MGGRVSETEKVPVGKRGKSSLPGKERTQSDAKGLCKPY